MSLEDRAKELAAEEQRRRLQQEFDQAQVAADHGIAVAAAMRLSVEFVELCKRHGVSPKTLRLEGGYEREVWIVQPHHWVNYDTEVLGIAVDAEGSAHFFKNDGGPDTLKASSSNSYGSDDPYDHVLEPPALGVWQEMIEGMSGGIVLEESTDNGAEEEPNE